MSLTPRSCLPGLNHHFLSAPYSRLRIPISFPLLSPFVFLLPSSLWPISPVTSPQRGLSLISWRMARRIYYLVVDLWALCPVVPCFRVKSISYGSGSTRAESLTQLPSCLMPPEISREKGNHAADSLILVENLITEKPCFCFCLSPALPWPIVLSSATALPWPLALPAFTCEHTFIYVSPWSGLTPFVPQPIGFKREVVNACAHSPADRLIWSLSMYTQSDKKNKEFINLIRNLIKK